MKKILILVCIIGSTYAIKDEISSKKSFGKFEILKKEELKRPKFMEEKTFKNAVGNKNKAVPIILNSGSEAERPLKNRLGKQERMQMPCAGWNGMAMPYGGGMYGGGGGWNPYRTLEKREEAQENPEMRYANMGYPYGGYQGMGMMSPFSGYGGNPYSMGYGMGNPYMMGWSGVRGGGP